MFLLLIGTFGITWEEGNVGPYFKGCRRGTCLLKFFYAVDAMILAPATLKTRPWVAVVEH
jgi:hypothetical protein